MNLPKSVMFILALSLFGCKKLELDNYHGVVKNSLNQPVRLDLYATLEDYYNNKNVASSVVIPAKGEWEVPKEYEVGRKFYLDWYSDDFSNSNWGSDPQFTIAAVTEDFGPILTIKSDISSPRKVWLSGNQPSSEWTAFDAKYSSFNPSLWSGLTDNQRFKHLVIRKNLTGTYTYKKSDGILESMDFTFSLNNTPSYAMSVAFEENNPLTYSISQAPLPSGFDFALDTVVTASNFPPYEGNSYNYYYYRSK